MATLIGVGGSNTGGRGSFIAIICWDGNSVPVPANIPAGVTVTYQGTSYTGTLAASRSTLRNSYLVHAGGSGEGDMNVFDEYVTAINYSTGAYTWELMGPAEITLANYVSTDPQMFTEQRKAQARNNIDAAKEPTISTTLPETLADNTEYRLGSQSSLALVLPASGEYGIMVSFTASAAFTPTVTGTIAGASIPTTVSGKKYRFLFDWDGAAWVVSYITYS